MHAWESIQDVVDYIEEHLTEDLPLEELAKIAALSPFYFQRLFRKLVGLPVGEYTRMRRLAAASELLRSSNRTVLDIASEYRFSNHTNFTRAFKKAFGITPNEMRHVRTMVNQYQKPDLLLQYVMVDEGVPLVTDGIVLEVCRKKLEQPKSIIGFQKEIPISDIMGGQTAGVSVVGAMWDELHKIKGSIQGLVPNGQECSVVSADDAKPGHCIYLAGAEATTDTAPAGLSTFVMPAQEYIVYGFEAETFEELVSSAEYKAQTFMRRWMETHGLTRGNFAVEQYGSAEEGPAYLETWLDFHKIDDLEVE